MSVCKTLLLCCRRKFEPGDKVTFSTKEHWCKTCTAEADGATSPSSPASKKIMSPLSVSPPKPPRANDTVDSEGLGLTPSTDKSLYHACCVFVCDFKTKDVDFSVIELDMSAL